MTKWNPTASQAVYRAGFQKLSTEIRSFHSLSTFYQQSNQSASDASSDKILPRDSAHKELGLDAFLSLRNTTSTESGLGKTTSLAPSHDDLMRKRSTPSSKSYNPVQPVLVVPTTSDRLRAGSRSRPPIKTWRPTPSPEPSQSKMTSSELTTESYIPSFSVSPPAPPTFTPRSRPSISKQELSALIQHVRPSSSSSPVEPKLPLMFHLPTDLAQAVHNQDQVDSRNLLELLLTAVMSRSHQAQQVMALDSNTSKQTVDSFSRPSTEQDDTHPIRTADIDTLILRILSPAYENPANLSLLLNLLPMLLSFAPERSLYMSPKIIAFLLFNSSDPVKGFEYLDSQCRPEDQSGIFSSAELCLIWKAWVYSSQPYRALQHAQTRLHTMGLPANEGTFDDHVLGIFLRYPVVQNLKTIVRHLPRNFQNVSHGQPIGFEPTVQDVLIRLFSLAEIAEDETFMFWTFRRICHLSQAEPIKGQDQGIRREIQTAAEVVILSLVERWDLPGMRSQIGSLTRYLDPSNSIIIPPKWVKPDLPKDSTATGERLCTPVDLDILDRISRTWTDDRKGRLWKALVEGSASEDGQSWKSVFQVYLLGSKGIHHELERPEEMIFPVIETLGKNLDQCAGDQKKRFAHEVLVDKAFIHTLMTIPTFRLTSPDPTITSTLNMTVVPEALSVQAGRIVQTLLASFLETPVLPRTENKLYDALLEALSRLTAYRPILELNNSKDALRHLLTLAPSPALMVRTIQLFLLFRPHQATTSADNTNGDNYWSQSIFTPELASETSKSILSRLSSTPDVSQPGPILDLIDLSNETIGIDVDVETRLGWLRRLLSRYIEILTLLDLPPTANAASKLNLSLGEKESRKSNLKGKANKSYRAHQLGEIRNAIIKVERWVAERPDFFSSSSSASAVTSNQDIRGLIAQIKLKTRT